MKQTRRSPSSRWLWGEGTSLPECRGVSVTAPSRAPCSAYSPVLALQPLPAGWRLVSVAMTRAGAPLTPTVRTRSALAAITWRFSPRTLAR